MPREPPAGADLCAVLLPAQQVPQGRARARARVGGRSPASLGKEGLLPPPLPSLFCSHLESVARLESSGELVTISVTGTLYLQVSGASSTGTVLGRKVPSMAPAQGWASGPRDSEGRALLGHRLWLGCPKGLVLLFSQKEGQGQLLQLLVTVCRESSLLGPAWCPGEVSWPC